MNQKAMFSSGSDEWATPQELFDALNAEFAFTLDPCANEENHKCERFFTREQNGLLQNWGGETVFCNPPYGKELPKWVKKASDEASKGNTTVVMLIPARTDTRYFHELIWNQPGVEVRFLRGRLKFGAAKNSAPFPSMVVIFGRRNT